MVLLHQQVSGLASLKVASFKLYHDGTNGDVCGFALQVYGSGSAFNSNSGSLLNSGNIYLFVDMTDFEFRRRLFNFRLIEAIQQQCQVSRWE